MTRLKQQLGRWLRLLAGTCRRLGGWLDALAGHWRDGLDATAEVVLTEADYQVLAGDDAVLRARLRRFEGGDAA